MREEDSFTVRIFRPAADGSVSVGEAHTSYPGRYKASDTFAQMGPFLVTRDEVPDPAALTITCHLGDRLVASDNTKNYVWSVADALSHISRTMTLLPGDIVSMGTAVGGERDPDAPQVPGVTRANRSGIAAWSRSRSPASAHSRIRSRPHEAAMNRSDKRILTTHVGSLPRPASLVAAYRDEPMGSPKLGAVLKESVRDVVQKQLDTGIDVIDDGEFGKPVHGEVDYGAWMTYLASRMQGFEIRPGQTGMFPGKDREDFHDFYCTHAIEIGEIRPVEVVCTGPVSYSGQADIGRDLANFRAALGIAARQCLRAGGLPPAWNRCNPMSTTGPRRNMPGHLPMP
jgi:hypothetical protein